MVTYLLHEQNGWGESKLVGVYDHKEVAERTKAYLKTLYPNKAYFIMESTMVTIDESESEGLRDKEQSD